MDVAVLGVLVTMLLAILGITYSLGRYSMRVDSLEEWRKEQRVQHQENQTALEAIRLQLAGMNHV